MNAEKKPWLFLKRINTWSPLGGMRDLMAPRPVGVEKAQDKQRKAWQLRARWSLTD